MSASCCRNSSPFSRSTSKASTGSEGDGAKGNAQSMQVLSSIKGYTIHEKLREGQCSTIYRVTSARGKELALKTYDGTYRKGDFLKEVHFLTVAQGHPNVGALHEVQDRRVKAIVTPLYTRDLGSHCSSRGGLSESEAAQVMIGLLKAVQHIHGLDIVHRNINPESVYVKRGFGFDAVLSDFDNACYSNDNFAMQAYAGSSGYAAPEVFSGAMYSAAVDLFSVGCTMYFMVALTHPSLEDAPREDGKDLQSTKDCEIEFGEQFDVISQNCKHFITRFVKRDASSRWSAREGLAHPWLTPSCRGQVQAMDENGPRALGMTERLLLHKEVLKLLGETESPDTQQATSLVN
eukprot:TRINITY_DN40601_c0_g1_i1.p1 TRINITY_DN40601_c0_g1~~TRINITY_DN40601_c0_g1_i1.p1  ORF type:complete len:348 (-),score=43.70 TRINITY_DN40601_c0_g1_i1:124-1167(-)